MKKMNMKASSEKGQVIVLYAIFILFLVIVGLTMVDLGKLVMFKTKLRCVTDQSAFSTSVVERNDGPIVDNIQMAPEYARLIYSTVIMLDNLRDAAILLRDYDVNYSNTANYLELAGAPYIDSLMTLADQLVSFPTGVQYEDSSFLTMDTGIVSTSFIEEAYSFSILEKMIIYDNVLAKNVENSTQPWQNIDTILLPSVYFLKKEPVLSSDLSSISPGCTIMNGKIERTITYTKTGTDHPAKEGLLCLQIANVPELLISDTFISSEGRMGKQMMGSYAGLTFPTGYNVPNQWLDLYNQSLHAANLVVMGMVEDMEEQKNSGASWTDEQNFVRNSWDNIIDEYNDCMADFQLEDGLDMQDPYTCFQESYPHIDCLQDFYWNLDPDYDTLAQGQGFDLTQEDELHSFFQSITLEDIFLTEENFSDTIFDSIDTFKVSANSFPTEYASYLTTISSFEADNTTPTNSITSTLYVLVSGITNYSSYSTSNWDVLLYLSQLSSALSDQYDQFVDFQELLTHRTGFDYDTLKPDVRIDGYMSTYFSKPISQWIQN